MIRRGKDIKNVFFHDSKCGEIRYTVIFAGRQVCGRIVCVLKARYSINP